MSSIVILSFGAGISLLLIGHFISRSGLPREAFSVSEGFVLGHWAFILLNALLLAATGGEGWAAVRTLGNPSLFLAAGVAALGLASFLIGSALPTLRVRLPPSGAPSPGSMGAVLAAAIVLLAVGGSASLTNTMFVMRYGFAARETELIAISQLLVPGAVFGWATMVWGDTMRVRWAGAFLFFLGAGAMAFEWSRRYLIVVVGAAVLLLISRRSGAVPRRAILVAAPLLAGLAVVGLSWRDVVLHGVDPWNILHEGVGHVYARSLWIESSAFSALAALVRDYGLWTAHGFGSMASAFLFWLPRSLFPWKPTAFQMSTELGINTYAVAPTIYGEILVDGTIISIVPLMLVLGVVMKSVDIAALHRGRDPAVRAIHAVLALDAVFLVRGAFHTMAMPMMIHSTVPFILLWILRKFGRREPVPDA